MQIWRRIIFGMEAVTVRGLEKGVHLGVRGEFGGSWWEWVAGVGIGGDGVDSYLEWIGGWVEEEAEKGFRLHQ